MSDQLQLVDPELFTTYRVGFAQKLKSVLRNPADKFRLIDC